MKPSFFALFSAFLLVSVLSSIAYANPVYDGHTAGTPTNYDFNTVSSINVSWSNSTNTTTITSVNISLNGTAAPVSLIEGDEYTGIYNYNETLGAGFYEWNSCAVDSDGNETCIGPYNFTITKSDPSSSMNIEINGDYNDTPLSLQYLYPLSMNAWDSNEGDDDCAYYLYRNDINLSDTLSDDEILGVSVYDYVYNSTECTNYTSGAVSRLLSVFKKSETMQLYLNDIAGNRTNGNSYDLYDSLEIKVFLNVSNASVSVNSTYPAFTTLSNNSSTTQNNTFNSTNLTTSGLYSLTAYWEGNENYSAASKTYYFGVIPYWTNEVLSIPNNSVYTKNATYNFQIDVVGSVSNMTFESNFLNASYATNYTNTTTPAVQKNGSTYWINFTGLPANENGYNYRWYAVYDDETTNSDQKVYTVSKIPITLSWTSPSVWSVDAGTTATVTCQANDTINITMGVGSYAPITALEVASTDVSSSSSNSFICFCRPADNTNYSGYITSALEFIVQETTTTTTTTTSSGGDSTTGGSFLIKDLVTTLAVGTGDSTSTGFTVSNTRANNMVDVKLSVTGIPASWYKLSKTTIDILQKYKPESVSITFNIPSDADIKEYDVTITARGSELNDDAILTTTKSMKLNVEYKEPSTVEPLNVEGTLEDVQTASVENEENVTSNSTLLAPTGLLATFEYLQNNLVIIIAIASCLLIFMFRNNITNTLRGGTGEKPAKTGKKKLKMPDFKKKLGGYSLEIDLKKGGVKQVDEKEDKRPEVLEREIKRDIKELQGILDAENKMKKKKTKLQNN